MSVPSQSEVFKGTIHLTLWTALCSLQDRFTLSTYVRGCTVANVMSILLFTEEYIRDNISYLFLTENICYNGGCHCKSQTTTSHKIAHLTITVDKMHFNGKGHTDDWCKE